MSSWDLRLGTLRYRDTTVTASLDTSFGNDGKVTTDFGVTATASAVAIDASGKIVVSGKRSLARYNSDGSLDTSFGDGGKGHHGLLLRG